MPRTHIALVAPAALAFTALTSGPALAETNSYFAKGYEYSTLHP